MQKIILSILVSLFICQTGVAKNENESRFQIGFCRGLREPGLILKVYSESRNSHRGIVEAIFPDKVGIQETVSIKGLGQFKRVILSSQAFIANAFGLDQINFQKKVTTFHKNSVEKFHCIGL